MMTIVSVAIGRSLRGVPEFLQSGLPIGEWGGAALLIYFGIRTLKVRLAQICMAGLLAVQPGRRGSCLLVALPKLK